MESKIIKEIIKLINNWFNEWFIGTVSPSEEERTAIFKIKKIINTFQAQQEKGAREKRDHLFYLDGKQLIKQAENKLPKLSNKRYAVILVKKDYFFKGTMINEFYPEISIPQLNDISVFFNEDIITNKPTIIEELRFEYVGLWGKFLIYKEGK